jgi:ribonuclease D
MTIKLHKGDLAAGLDFGPSVAVDTETLGLLPRRDKLCLVQLSSGDGNAHLVQLDRSTYNAPNLKALLTDPNITKIFHFARLTWPCSKHYLAVEHSRSTANWRHG